MTLRQKQSNFSLALAKLIIYAYSLGYEITFGDVFAKTGHKVGSVHYLRLAGDLNLFKDGKWLDTGVEMEKGHNLLHDYWDTLGGAKRIAKDLNHYSFEHEGSW
jgi:hypothetical protein